MLSFIRTVIDDDMNGMLNQEFNEQEVVAALKKMAPLKTPGLDRMPPLFYQHLGHNYS